MTVCTSNRVVMHEKGGLCALWKLLLRPALVYGSMVSCSSDRDVQARWMSSARSRVWRCEGKMGSNVVVILEIAELMRSR